MNNLASAVLLFQMTWHKGLANLLVKLDNAFIQIILDGFFQ